MNKIFEGFDWKNGKFDAIQEAYLKQYAQERIAAYLSTEPTNEDLAWTEIKKAYKVAKLPEPQQIIWYDSPRHFVDSVGASVRNSVRNSVWNSVWDSVWNSVGDSVRNSVGDSVRNSVRNSVWNSVWDSVWNSVGDSVRNSVGDSVWDSVRAWSNSGYDPWLRFFNDHQEKNDFVHICRFDEQVTGYLLTSDTVHAIRKPKRLVRNGAGRLHYDHDKAIEWHDGYGFHYLSGVEFDEKTWKDIVDERVTLKTLGNITNADQRAVAVQMLRADRLLEQVKARLIHTGERGVELYEVKNFMDTGETEYCMKLEHPSIEGKMYIEWVHPDTGKLKDADICMAKSRGLTKEQYLSADLA